MSQLSIVKREISQTELNRIHAGFDEHALEMGVKIQRSKRFTYTALDQGKFIGCSSGLAYLNGEEFNGWFYLTDLYVEREYRTQGLGARLLRALEKEISSVGVSDIWTWTAGYEAPGFYLKQGYHIFSEMENWYSDGSSRVGLKRNILK